MRAALSGAKARRATPESALWSLIVLVVTFWRMITTAGGTAAFLVDDNDPRNEDRGGRGVARQSNSPSAPANIEESADVRINAFVRWFQDHGGWVHPHVTLAHVPAVGGWGLVSESPLGPDATILRVPSSLVLTRDRALRELLLSLPLYPPAAVSEDLASLLGDMDDAELLAAYLWTESCRGGASFWEPYVQILPRDVPPLLFAMDDRVRELLGDDGLQQLARDTSARVEVLWTRLQPVVRAMSPASDGGKYPPSPSSSSSSSSNPDASSPPCDSLAEFRRFYAVVLSHGMSINPSPDSVRTVLVPMADMINHHPISRASSSTLDDGQPNFDFGKFHVLHANGSMTVTTDQSTIPVVDVAVRQRGSSLVGDEVGAECAAVETTATSIPVAECPSRPGGAYHMVVEQYSELDNSLYLEKFGFVPDHNEHHCVLLSLFPVDPPSRVATAATPAVCVKANGHPAIAQATKDARHEMATILEVLRGGKDVVRREAPEVERDEFNKIEQCAKDVGSSADNPVCAVAWRVWRRLVKRAAAERLKALNLHQHEHRRLIESLSKSHATEVQIAMKFVQSDIEVLQLLTRLDET